MPPTPKAPVRLSGTYTFPKFDRLVTQLKPMLELDSPTPLHLDMSRMSFVGPAAIAVILACLRRMEVEELIEGGGFWLPKSDLTRRYLLRMDLFRRLDLFVDPEETFKRRKAEVFQPLENFETEEDRGRVVQELVQALMRSCNVDPSAEQSTFIFLTELTENAVQHAGSKYGGFAAAQALKKRPTFEMGVVDLGIGVRASLKKAGIQSEDDVDAIRKALTRGVTSNAPVNSGEGLFVTAEALTRNGGDLLIRSRRGTVVVGAHESSEMSETDFPGTLVAFRARTDQPLDYHAIYRELHPPNG